MDIEQNNVSRKNEGKKINDFKNLDYKEIPFNLTTERIFSQSFAFFLNLCRISV
jgi:hypothetical protein